MLILNPVNEYSSAFPLLECVHIAGIVCGVGTAALLNLRLLGVGLTQNSPGQLWKSLMPWTLGGLALAILAGLLLFSIDPEMYYESNVFRLKMLFLMLAIVFYFTMVRKAAAAGNGSTFTQIVALVSLALWTLVPFGGIFISFAGSSLYAYPALLAVHIVTLVLLGGMVVVTDLRWLGVAMRGISEAQVVDGLRLPKRIAFGLSAISGVILFSVHAGQYLSNPWFWVKISLLVVIGANSLILRSQTKLLAKLSLLLWAGVILAARGPATVKDIMHSLVDPGGDFLFHSVRMISDDQGIREIAPHTDAGWEDVRQRLVVLQGAPDLLRGRRAARTRDRSKNPAVENQPEEVQELLDADRPDFIRRAQRLQDVASLAIKAVDAKDKAALLLGLDGIDKACESCHLRYWYPKDKRAHEAAKEDGVIE